MHSLSSVFHLIILYLTSSAIAKPALYGRDLSCDPSEVNTLKCSSPVEFYLCPTPGQQPIPQRVAEGTECRNNAIIAIGQSYSRTFNTRAPNGAPPPIPSSTSTTATSRDVATSKDMTPLPSSPATTSTPPLAPLPKETTPLTPFEPAPSGAPNPCYYGGEPTTRLFSCKNDIKDDWIFPGAVVWGRALYCLDYTHYTVCEGEDTTVCEFTKPYRICKGAKVINCREKDPRKC